MTNWHVDERLSAYLANELEAKERDFVESHLEICHFCRQELELLQELDLILDEMPMEDPGQDFTDSVMARIQKESQQAKLVPLKTTRTRLWKTSDFRNMAASMVAAFVLFQGFTGVVPFMPEMDNKIRFYTTVTKVKLEIWVDSITHKIN
jgi:anti-sigma factor RsiW